MSATVSRICDARKSTLNASVGVFVNDERPKRWALVVGKAHKDTSLLKGSIVDLKYERVVAETAHYDKLSQVFEAVGRVSEALLIPSNWSHVPVTL